MFTPNKIKRQLFSACIAFFSCIPLALFAETTVIKTYILTGQSNGNGYGLAYGDVATGTLIPNQDLADIGRGDLLPSNDSAYIYQGAWTTGAGSWENLAPGFASWNGIRFGPELSFGHKMQSELNEPIAIIKYTPNGTSLYSEWLAGQYDLLIETINNAKASATGRDWELDIQGLLWMQGESDSFGVDAPAVYEERLTSFVSKVREGLALPALKFHVAEIADSPAWGARQQIWDAQAAVAAADDNVVVIASRDYPLFANDASGSVNIHLTTAGVVTLGEAFASSVVGENLITPPIEEPEVGTGYISHTVSDNSIIIDANLDDWSAVESLGYDGETLQDAGVRADFVEGWIAHDNNSLYVAYTNNGDIDTVKSWPWQVYFDTDGAKSTGMKVDDNIGAEYMLQGSAVFKYTGSGSDWSWQYIVTATNAVNGPVAEYKIPRLALSFPDKLKVLFKARNVAFTGDYAESGVDTYPRQVKPIALHYGLLQGQSAIWRESGGVLPMAVSEAASAGVTALQMSESYSLLDNQLITYLSENGEYYIAQVASVDGATINLSKPLEAPIAQRQEQNLWNFYGDASHPNLFGFRAVVDFAIREMGIAELNSGKHVLLGDSWFDNPNPGFKEWLSERLSGATIVNKGFGGNTSADMLSRFDADVASESPDVVWVMAGINDATSDVTASDYLANMQAIIAKIKLLGAKPMVVDSQIAQLFSGSDYRTQLTHSYSQALGDANSAVQYQLTESVIPPDTDAISNPKSIAIDGNLADWGGLQAFGQDADDINEADAKADLLEAWMAHDDSSFYIAYKNDGVIDTTIWWPWQVFLDTDNNQGTGYQVGNGVGASYLVQGGYLFSYIGTGYDWAWQFVEAADYQVNADVAELKFSRAAINNPDSLSTVLKARNGFFTNNYTASGVDSFPDLDQGHFNYRFSDPIAIDISETD